MKIIATFDRTAFSESIIPNLVQIAALPNAEFTLLSIAHEPDGKLQKRGIARPIVAGDLMGRNVPILIDRTEPTFAENKGQAIDRRIAETEEYLADICHRLPQGTACHIEAHVADDAAKAIIARARELQPDVIVMATHSRGRMAHVLFGSTTEEVIRSCVAPVLVVHPTDHD